MSRAKAIFDKIKGEINSHSESKRNLLLSVLVALSFAPQALGAQTRPEIGFYSPTSENAAYAGKVDFAIVNIGDIANLERKLKMAHRENLKLYLNIGLMLTKPKSSSGIKTSYFDPENGKIKAKYFTTVSVPKLIDFSADVENLLKPTVKILSQYKENIGGLILVDEPYINGISKKSLEDEARAVHSFLNKNGLKNVEIGVNFSNGMFDKDFAQIMDKSFTDYAKSIDKYAASLNKNDPQLKRLKKYRLTTYDQAGNDYHDGGIPRGYDFYSFDSHISTYLLDSSYEDILSYFVDKKKEPSCQVFAGMKMSGLKGRLSFFKDQSIDASTQDIKNDRDLLDNLYQCRVGTLMTILEAQISRVAPGARVILVSESSDNGLTEFTSHQVRKQHQPQKLVESRVLDEVKRAFHFQNTYPAKNLTSIAFFLFDDEYDSSIGLNLHGVKSFPSVMNYIYKMRKSIAHSRS